MINDIIKDAEDRMQKSLSALEDAFKRIRTGRAHPSLLDSVMVSYYGADTPLSQLANINHRDVLRSDLRHGFNAFKTFR